MLFTDRQFYVLWGAALTTADRDQYLSEWSTSSLLLPEDGEDIPQSLVEAIRQVWQLAHMTVAQIRATTGLSQAAFAERFCIPRRTLEAWEGKSSSSRKCPDYVRLLLLRSLGLVNV